MVAQQSGTRVAYAGTAEWHMVAQQSGIRVACVRHMVAQQSGTRVAQQSGIRAACVWHMVAQGPFQPVLALVRHVMLLPPRWEARCRCARVHTHVCVCVWPLHALEAPLGVTPAQHATSTPSCAVPRSWCIWFT